LRIVVTGLIAQYPLGGVTWDYLQYPAGLLALGHDVYYVEDTGQWPYNPHDDGITKSCSFNVEYLAGIMRRFGLSDRWAYRFPWQGEWFGLSDEVRTEIVRTADIVVNVSGTLRDPESMRPESGRLVYIDSDPVFTQVKLARGQEDFRAVVDAHDVHFSFGESHSPEVPVTGHEWLPTRQPILCDEWFADGPGRDHFTTIMNWSSYNPVTYGGRTFGQKDIEFRNYLDLPQRVSPVPLEVALGAGKVRRAPHDLLRHRGWNVVDPLTTCGDVDSYRHYIQSSRAEWSVAKHGYVVGRPGWFSCRSACYLAAGRPVVVEDTGFSSVLPTGEGIVPFRDPAEAVEGIREVEGNYGRHAAAARDIAREYFAADRVLAALIARALDATSSVRAS
jgi:hypothetical protein